MGNKISMGEADLIFEKLYSESIPVVAYYVRGGVKVMRHGVVAGVSSLNGESSIIVGDKEDVAKENIPLYDYIAVAPGSTEAGCTFWYGDKRELPDKTRAETVEKLGDTVLAIECADGGRLQLYFSL